MAKRCPFCGGEIALAARKCRHCRKWLPEADAEDARSHANAKADAGSNGRNAVQDTENQTSSGEDGENGRTRRSERIVERIRAVSQARIGGGLGRSMGIFMAANAGIMIVLTMIAHAVDPKFGLGTFLLLLLLGCAVPFLTLFFSKSILKSQYGIEPLTHENAKDEKSRFLVTLVETLSRRAGLPAVPEVGVYESNEMNAFATGATKRDAMIAFSSALVKEMDEESIAAVAAHETAHIANGDMLTMTLLQGLVNIAVIVIDFALRQMDWYDEMRKKSRFLADLVHFLVVNVLFLLGDLVLLWFSRHREFEADATAASLVGSNAMAGALEKLKDDPHAGETIPSNDPAAAMAISAPEAWLDLFSTHPSLERRIERLKTPH